MIYKNLLIIICSNVQFRVYSNRATKLSLTTFIVGNENIVKQIHVIIMTLHVFLKIYYVFYV